MRTFIVMMLASWTLLLSQTGLPVSARADSGAAQAAPAGGPARACQADFEKFCKGKVQGPKEAMACMAGHRSELSDACKAQQAERRKACAADVEKFCSDKKGKPGEVMACLAAHSRELSPGCRMPGHPGAK
jgi:hypothetical protein